MLRLRGCGGGCQSDDDAKYLTVHVKTQKGRTGPVSLLSIDPIERVKAMVEAQDRLQAESSRLLHGGRDLCIGITVGEYCFYHMIVEEVRKIGIKCSGCVPAGESKPSPEFSTNFFIRKLVLQRGSVRPGELAQGREGSGCVEWRLEMAMALGTCDL